MYPDTEKEADIWIQKLRQTIDRLKGSSPTPTKPSPTFAPAPTETQNPPAAGQSSSAPSGFGNSEIRQKLERGKKSVGFLHDEDSKVLEFWQIWSESIPPSEEIDEGSSVLFEVSTNATMEKLQWRTSGAQHIFIQRMVDFFWNVGAPETEIDRLNDVGALINPMKIGSWIDMSIHGGMDGGWFFPVQVSLSNALKAADAGDPVTKVEEWGKSKDLHLCDLVARDMGAAPPRQTEIQLQLTGNSEAQLQQAVSAFEEFGFPPIPDSLLNAIRGGSNYSMSIITSSEGFVRLGLRLANPTPSIVVNLQKAINEVANVTSKPHEMTEFQKAIGSSGPNIAEIQFLMEGFGYGVYQEGFDVVFHYTVGEELPQ